MLWKKLPNSGWTTVEMLNSEKISADSGRFSVVTDLLIQDIINFKHQPDTNILDHVVFRISRSLINAFFSWRNSRTRILLEQLSSRCLTNVDWLRTTSLDKTFGVLRVSLCKLLPRHSNNISATRTSVSASLWTVGLLYSNSPSHINMLGDPNDNLKTESECQQQHQIIRLHNVQRSETSRYR